MDSDPAWQTVANAFLQRTLEGFTTPTPLPEGVRSGERGGALGRHREETQLSAEATGSLQSVAAEHGLNLRSIVSGAWGILLSRYSSYEDVLFAILDPSSSSAFLPVRLQVDGHREWMSWLADVNQKLATLYGSGQAPEVRGSHAVSGNAAMFETAIVFSAPEKDVRLPLVLYVYAGAESELRIVADYDGQRFSEGALPRILGCMRTLLENLTASRGETLSSISLMAVCEIQDLLVRWNDTQADFPGNKCVHTLFEEQARQSPGSTAVIFRRERLSYQKLDEKANQLAWKLQELGAGPETIVAICVERTLEMVIGLLGILKAGAAYLPLDPAFPSERLQFMLEDSHALVVVTQDHLAGRFPQTTQILTMPSGPVAPAPRSPDDRAKSHNLAYVIYTSGSTGKPKGVMVEHRQVANFFAGMDRVVGPEPGVWLAVTSISFDISVLELFWTLARGFTVVVQAEAEKLTLGGEHSVAAQIRNHRATHLQCTPSMARFLVADPDSLRSLGCLRKLILGGEALSAGLVAQLRPAVSGDIFNLYGPTETTVWSAAHRILEDETTVPIGRPIANTQIYILDTHLKPVPVGIPGELFIGGAGVARGYLNRPELSSERFLPDPFRSGSSDRMYRTGDLARYRPNGEIEFLGRIDNQIKILGFRIEPEEIEAVLGRHPAVRAAAVVPREDVPGEKKLIAYLELGEKSATAEELRIYLRHKLPAHMVPAAFVIQESLPSTPNGKIDKKALAALVSSPAGPADSVATDAHLEQTVSRIWQEALGLAEVGVDDNFFDLGANSLVMGEVAVKLRDTLSRDIPLTELFKYPTIQALTAYLNQGTQDDSRLRRSVDRAQSRKEAMRLRSQGGRLKTQDDRG